MEADGPPISEDRIADSSERAMQELWQEGLFRYFYSLSSLGLDLCICGCTKA